MPAPDGSAGSTSGFIPTECPGGYQCPPSPQHGCLHPDLFEAPNGLCTLDCWGNPDVCLPESTCVQNFACGIPCETFEDCEGLGDWAACWVTQVGVSICADKYHDLPGTPMADSGSST